MNNWRCLLLQGGACDVKKIYCLNQKGFLQLQILIFFIQRPPSENIRSFSVIFVYNNVFIIDFLVKM